MELTSFGCLYTLVSKGKAVPLIRRYAATPSRQGEVCIKVKKIEIDLYRLLTQTLSPKGKARKRQQPVCLKNFK